MRGVPTAVIPSAHRISALILTLFLPLNAFAQGGYYNLDAGRPTRIEDATPAARYELELQVAPLRFEKLASGVKRWRVEPKLTYGIAPYTELEVRSPFLVVNPADSGSRRREGFGGIGIGVMHAFGVEQGNRPAVALAGEWVAPAGGLSATVGSYTVKGIATKTFPAVRTHVNVGYGTYATRLDLCAQPRAINVAAPPGCPPGPVPFDPPCIRIPGVSALCSGGAAMLKPDSIDVTRSVGMRWMAGAGIDRAFALRSTLVSADVLAERFAGLLARTDLSAEIAVHHQLTPQVVVDLGLSRHFGGLLRANWISLGLGYGLPLTRGAR